MLCEKCKQNVATVHVQEIVNGVVENHSFCAACAADIHTSVSMEDMFKGFLGSVFEMAEQVQKGKRHAAQNDTTCTNCGLTYSAFRKTGRFGCAECYDAFRPHVEITLKNVHGAVAHEGKLPNRLAADLLYKRDVESSKTALRKAIEEENYEEAARLRDRIRQLEKDGAPSSSKQEGSL